MSNKKTRNHKKGFTLIELLVVIAIIGLLATIAVVSLNSSRARARDSKRVSDIRQIQTALELYHQEHQSYPEGDGLAHEVLDSVSPGGIEEYIIPIPEAPTPADGNCDTENNTYYYEETEDGKSYQLSYCIGASTGSLESGHSYATPMYIQVSTGVSTGGGSFTCGDDFTDTRDDNVYSTVLIGDQCWMQKNLAWLPEVTEEDSWDSTTDAQYAVYDYTGTSVEDAKNEANYTTYGVLYNWPAATTACPEGWSLPTDDEWHILEDFLATGTCDSERSGWGCEPAGESLKTDTWEGNNNSGFTAFPAGIRYANGPFGLLGDGALFWSSSGVEGVFGFSAWIRRLGSGYSGVYRNDYIPASGYSVRCLRTD